MFITESEKMRIHMLLMNESLNEGILDGLKSMISNVWSKMSQHPLVKEIYDIVKRNKEVYEKLKEIVTSKLSGREKVDQIKQLAKIHGKDIISQVQSKNTQSVNEKENIGASITAAGLAGANFSILYPLIAKIFDSSSSSFSNGDITYILMCASMCLAIAIVGMIYGSGNK